MNSASGRRSFHLYAVDAAFLDAGWGFAPADRQLASLPLYFTIVAVSLAHCSTVPGALASLRT